MAPHRLDPPDRGDGAMPNLAFTADKVYAGAGNDLIYASTRATLPATIT